MAELLLPSQLTSLFVDLPREVQVDAPNVDGAIDELDRHRPGLRDPHCEPGPAQRRHNHVYVDRERAALETPIDERSRVHVIAAISGG